MYFPNSTFPGVEASRAAQSRNVCGVTPNSLSPRTAPPATRVYRRSNLQAAVPVSEWRVNRQKSSGVSPSIPFKDRWEVFDRKDVQLRIYGDSAVVIGDLEAKGRGAKWVPQNHTWATGVSEAPANASPVRRNDGVAVAYLQRFPVSLPGDSPANELLLRRPQRLVRLQKVLDSVLFRERRVEEPVHGRIEELGLLERHHVRRIRKNAKLAIRNVMVDLERVLVADQVVIACQHKRGRGDRLQRFRLDVRLVQQHLRHLQFASALRCLSFGGRRRALKSLGESNRFRIGTVRLEVCGHGGNHFYLLGMTQAQ